LCWDACGERESRHVAAAVVAVREMRGVVRARGCGQSVLRICALFVCVEVRGVQRAARFNGCGTPASRAFA
jgi:hypothetical protein